jgi:hypothetical protein
LRSSWSAGRATFTTVPSMNAILEAMMVAARIQRPRALGHLSAAGPDRAALSWQGSRIIAHIASENRYACTSRSGRNQEHKVDVPDFIAPMTAKSNFMRLAPARAFNLAEAA